MLPAAARRARWCLSVRQAAARCHVSFDIGQAIMTAALSRGNSSWFVRRMQNRSIISNNKESEMAVRVEKLERVFVFNGAKLPDPNPEFSVEQVRHMYVNT
jgi:hypothetical protein